MNLPDLGSPDSADYSQLPHSALITLLKLYLLFAVRCVLKILLKGGGAAPEELWRDCRIIALDPSQTNAARLFKLHPDAKPIVYLLDLKLKRIAIEQEIERRLERHAFGRELLKLDDTIYSDAWTAPVLDQLGSGVRITPEPWEEPQDVVMEAIDRVKTFRIDLGDQYHIKSAHRKLPALPEELGFPIDDPPPWDKIVPAWFFRELAPLLRRLVPALDGTIDAEGKAEMVRAIETHARRTRRHRARGDDTAVDDIESHLPAPDEVLDQRQKVEKLHRALKELAERRGPKAKEYIESLLTSGRRGDAAEHAGVDPKTGKSYLLEFTMLVQDKALPRTLKAAKSSRRKKK